MSESAATLTVYSDYVCPFCNIGRASLESYLASADDPPAVEWHPFDLRANRRGPDGEIDPAADDGKDEAYFEQVHENVRRLRDDYGVEMELNASRDVDSRNAQLVALHVQAEHDPSIFEAFDAAVFDALWQEERDIGDLDVLVDIAEDAGIGAAEVRAALEDDDLHAALASRFEAARRRGVTGVPTFVYDGHAARGAVPPEQLARLVEG